MKNNSRSAPARLTALALCLALLAGCSRGAALPSAAASPVPETASGRYFPSLPDHLTSYADMDAQAYSLSDFTPYADAVSAFASGGSQTDFDAACSEAENALARLSTSADLRDLAASHNPADQTAARDYLSASQVYYDASDTLFSAFHQVAVSPSAELLNSRYADWQIDQFKSYAPSAASAGEDLYGREEQLESRYDTLMAADPVDYDAVAELYVELVQLRQRIASADGCDTYAQDAYDTYARSYTPQDAQAIWKSAREDFAPLVARYADGIGDGAETLTENSGLDCSPEALLSALSAGAAALSPELAAAAECLTANRLYDLSPTGTLDSGYTLYLYAYGEPFIFNTPSGSYSDYTALFHEFGHFANYLYCGSDLLFGVSDSDLSELQSQGMEVMFFSRYGDIFGAQSAQARAAVLLQLLYSVVDGAMYDEFQQKVYETEDLTADKVDDIFQEVYLSYGYQPYDGYEHEWMDLVHNFEQPFYYISYAVSALPALELFRRMETDPDGALDTYLTLAAMDTESWYLADALKETGLPSPFDADSSASLAAALDQSGALAP